MESSSSGGAVPSTVARGVAALLGGYGTGRTGKDFARAFGRYVRGLLKNKEKERLSDEIRRATASYADRLEMEERPAAKARGEQIVDALNWFGYLMPQQLAGGSAVPYDSSLMAAFTFGFYMDVERLEVEQMHSFFGQLIALPESTASALVEEIVRATQLIPKFWAEQSFRALVRDMLGAIPWQSVKHPSPGSRLMQSISNLCIHEDAARVVWDIVRNEYWWFKCSHTRAFEHFIWWLCKSYPTLALEYLCQPWPQPEDIPAAGTDDGLCGPPLLVRDLRALRAYCGKEFTDVPVISHAEYLAFGDKIAKEGPKIPAVTSVLEIVVRVGRSGQYLSPHHQDILADCLSTIIRACWLDGPKFGTLEAVIHSLLHQLFTILKYRLEDIDHWLVDVVRRAFDQIPSNLSDREAELYYRSGLRLIESAVPPPTKDSFRVLKAHFARACVEALKSDPMPGYEMRGGAMRAWSELPQQARTLPIGKKLRVAVLKAVGQGTTASSDTISSLLNAAPEVTGQELTLLYEIVQNVCKFRLPNGKHAADGLESIIVIAQKLGELKLPTTEIWPLVLTPGTVCLNNEVQLMRLAWQLRNDPDLVQAIKDYRGSAEAGDVSQALADTMLRTIGLPDEADSAAV